MKNKRTFPVITLSLLVFIGMTACNKNSDTNNAELSLNFQTKMNGSNFGMNQSYQSHNDVTIQYESFQFYLSDITLVNSDGEDRLISEIELFRFDEGGFSSIDFKAPSGKYDLIKFGIGVKKTLNDADPANYSDDADHPLNTLQNTYWGWTTAYRFVMSEGRYDADGDGEFEGVFAYHTGREVSYRTMEIPLEYEIDKKDPNTLAFSIDLFQLFDRPGNEIDLPEDSFYHGGTEDEYLTIKISDNMVSAISIQD